MRALLTASFVAGLIPAVILLVLYSARTRWWVTEAGQAFFALIGVTAGSYLLSVLALVLPSIFTETGGVWVRVVLRFAIALVLWNLLRLFFRAQREGRASSVAPPRKGNGESTV